MPGDRRDAELFATDDPAADEASAAGGYALVAPEQGVDVEGGLTYAVPATLADLAEGERVVVPLGRNDRPTPAYVLRRTSELPDELAGQRIHIKPVLRRDGSHVALTPDLVRLARWIAGYYVCPLGMVFRSMLPAAVKHGTGRVTRTLVEPVPTAETEGLTALQHAVLDAAVELGRPTEIKALADAAGAKTTGPVKALIDKGVLRAGSSDAVVSDLDLRAQQEAPPPTPVQLNLGQEAALAHLTEWLGNGFSVNLLHGVTGSGKTEVYLRAIEGMLARRRDEVTEGCTDGVSALPSPSPDLSVSPPLPPPGIIVLVPEIALTPQTVGRFIGRLGAERVAVLHSGLTAAQRHQQWRRIRDGTAHVVVGARSAIFAPLADPRLIIVDEEHDPSYKQDQLPRYHARDVAIKRAQLLGIPVVLGSATPSLESYCNATREDSGSSAWHLIELPERVPGAVLPRVQIIDLRQERRARRGVHLISQRLEQALRAVLDDHAPRPTAHGPSQAILLLNRRGFANYIACPDHRCGWLMTCDHCDVTTVYHKDASLPAGGVVRCHHCLAEQALPKQCPECGKKLTVFGLGTQRVEEELARKFPGVESIRMDSDAMKTGRHYHEALEKFREGGARVLLGTQMIAKGLDFPGVRLVGVISADTSLHMPDFRAAERTFQLIAQVAGRAGRRSEPGLVVVQSFNPHDPAVTLAAAHDYRGFAERELGVRREMRLPPIARMARVVVRHKDHTRVFELATQLAGQLNQANAALGLGVRLRGPAACAIARLADHHRMQIELLADPPDAASKLQRLLVALRNREALVSDATYAIDVDPVALL